MQVKIYGSSDDNVCFTVSRPSGKPVHDEIGCFRGDDRLHHATLRIATPGCARGVLVHALFDGTWSFAVGLLDEGRSIPPWRFDVDREHEYSTRLGVDTGDDLVEVIEVKQVKCVWTPCKAED